MRLFTKSAFYPVLFLVTICGNFHAAAQDVDQPENYIRLHYTKHEYMVPMRDGVKLMTSVFVPNDTTQTYPILLKRTPYNVAPYGEDQYPSRLGPSELFVAAGYIFVNQDVRGRFSSEGKFMQVTPHVPNKKKPTDVDESSDAYDTIEWLLRNVPNHNGRVGMYGISYPGFYAAAGMIDAHPALKAVSPQAPIGDWYFDDFLHHGSFFLAHAFSWLSNNSVEQAVPGTEPAPRYVYPSHDGYQMLIRSEVIRGRYRNDYAKPEPFVPNEPTLVRLELLDVLHRFRKDHRLMVQIQSTWFPLVDRNPQKYVPNIYFAKPDDFQKATHRVLRSSSHPTCLRLGILPVNSSQ